MSSASWTYVKPCPDGRFQIEVEDDDPFPVQMKLLLFSCTEP